MDRPSTSSLSATRNDVSQSNRDFISVGEALKLIPPFKGNKQEELAFIGNVDTAFEVINPEQETILYRFVLTCISGEPRTAISHRNFDNWIELKEFLCNFYIEKRTLGYHASQLFKAKQAKDERVTDWIQRIQTLGSQFREAALLNCSERTREGILDLSDRLRNICFVQGLFSDRIQTTVWSRNYQNFDEVAETTLVEESALMSKQGRYCSESAIAQRCSHCGKLGHSGNKCYSCNRMEARENPVVASGPATLSQITCFRCGEKGHLARNCRRPLRRRENNVNQKPSGKESEQTEGSRPTVAFHAVGCISTEKCDYVTLELDVSKGDKLFFLVDSGADISLIRGCGGTPHCALSSWLSS
jgi:hypothetical protein